MIELAKPLTYLGTRIQNYAYLLANPTYSKVRKNGGCGTLYRLLNKDWFPHQHIRTVLDVGTNEGQFIKTALALMPNVAIYGFEPNPEAVNKLKNTDWGSDKVNILPIACGSENAKLKLNISKFSPASSLLKMEQKHQEEFPGTETEKVISVEVERLDQIVPSLKIDSEPFLLKIDVQGFELEVLSGASGIFKQTPIIVCEVNLASLYENQCTFDSLIAFMRQHQYRLVDIGNPIRSSYNQEILFLDLAFKREKF
ncbi:MAG: FkbM family methyltransferase [Nostocaceae cyanobacterium]|nr:FkbM family methyltransferase [Nostocaceae cyanobacterium]